MVDLTEMQVIIIHSEHTQIEKKLGFLFLFENNDHTSLPPAQK